MTTFVIRYDAINAAWDFGGWECRSDYLTTPLYDHTLSRMYGQMVDRGLLSPGYLVILRVDPLFEIRDDADWAFAILTYG